MGDWRWGLKMTAGMLIPAKVLVSCVPHVSAMAARTTAQPGGAAAAPAAATKPAKGLLSAPLRARAGAPAALWAAWRGLERCTPQSASAHPAGRRETQAQCQMSLRQASMAWHGPMCPTLPAWLAAHPCAHGSPGGSLAARAAGATPPACRPAAGWSAR